MDSPNNQPFAGGRKLDRRLGRKILDYEPSDPSQTPVVDYQNSPRALDRDASGSFRVTGRDSQEEIQSIAEYLGLSGGADAFAIDAAAWDAGKTRRKSFDRFGATAQTRSRSSALAELSSEKGRYFDREVHGYSAMSSMSSEDSFSSDGSKSSTELPHLSVSSPYIAQDDFQEGKPMRSGVRVSEATEERMYSGDHLVTLSRTKSEETSRPVLATETPKCSSMESYRNPLPPPPPIRLDKDLRSVTTYDILDSLAPEGPKDFGNESIETKQVLVSDSGKYHGKSRRSRGRQSQVTERTSVSLEYQSRFAHQPSVHEAVQPFPLESRVEALLLNDASQQQRLVERSVQQNSEIVVEQVGSVGRTIQKRVISAAEQAAPSGLDNWGVTALARLEDDMAVSEIHSWKKLGMLGSGSYGTVYEAISAEGVYFAVKEVSLSDQGSKAQQCIFQLDQEIEMLSKYQHENIVRYLGTEKDHDKLYIFLELVTKGSLASLYQHYELFDSQIRRYTRQILYGLQYLHSNNIVHRDIKCANILVAANGKVKLADFGLARQISKFDVLKSCKGSAHWMAPEVIDPRKTYGFPADIWSLGCTVLEMATRCPPFGDMEMHRALWKIAHGEAPSIPHDLSEEAQDFITCCLCLDPDERPSASELLEHPFVQRAGGSGNSSRNSFSQEAALSRHQDHSK